MWNNLDVWLAVCRLVGWLLDILTARWFTDPHCVHSWLKYESKLVTHRATGDSVTEPRWKVSAQTVTCFTPAFTSVISTAGCDQLTWTVTTFAFCCWPVSVAWLKRLQCTISRIFRGHNFLQTFLQTHFYIHNVVLTTKGPSEILVFRGTTLLPCSFVS